MADILIIDDDPLICRLLSRMVERLGHDAVSANTLAQGLQQAGDYPPDVVFLDVRLPDGNGLTALADLKRVASEPEVIIMTGMGDPDGAELALKNGAWDYIEKPASVDKMKLPLLRALDYRQVHRLRGGVRVLKREEIIGDSPAMQTCLAAMAQAAESQANVLLTGETGVGKELFALGIHQNSARAEKNFVVVDCTALPETLVESLLFGHVRGSFTGAERSQRGLVEQANGGTLFLDEVGELPPSLQKSFLRVIQEHRFRPVGGDAELSSDFRLIAATNRDLEEMVRQGGFRQDLFFRLRSFHLELPPLRSRAQDIPDLVHFHLQRLCHRYKLRAKGLSPDFLEALQAYAWPGNVRELVNTLERTVAGAPQDPVLYPVHLPTYLRVHLARAAVTKDAPAPQAEASEREVGEAVDTDDLSPLHEAREAALNVAEERYLRQLMRQTSGDIKEACRVSQLSRGRLYALLKKYDISRPKGGQ